MTRAKLKSAREHDRDLVLDLAGGVLCLLLVWIPLPFASVVPWAHDLFRTAAFATLIVIAVSSARRLRSSAALVPAAAIAAVGALGVVQSVAWPTAWVARLVPARFALEAAPAPDRMALSLAPSMSGSMALTWLAVACFLLIASEVARSGRRRRWLLAALMISALFQLFYGARHWMSGTMTIWGLATPTDANRLRGTFVNADHFAMYLEIALATTMAWLWWAWRRRHVVGQLEQRLQMIAAPAALWLVLFAGIAFSGSRAAMLAVLTGVVAQAVAAAARDRQWRIGTAGLMAPILGVCLVAALGVQAGFGRWLATSNAEISWNGRLAVYGASLDLWRRFPVLGTGLASFRDAFTLVQPAEVRGSWWHAHNDLIELLLTTGVVGAALMAVAIGFGLVRLLRVIRHSERSEHGAVALAALGACAAILVHSCFDFGLTMPANAITLAALFGAGIAAPSASQRHL